MYIWEFRDEKILFVKTSYINGDYVKYVKKLFKTTLSIGNPMTFFLNVLLIGDFLFSKYVASFLGDFWVISQYIIVFGSKNERKDPTVKRTLVLRSHFWVIFRSFHDI